RDLRDTKGTDMPLPQDISPALQNIQDTLVRSEAPWIEQTPFSPVKVLGVGHEPGTWASLHHWKKGYVAPPHKHLAGSHASIICEAFGGPEVLALRYVPDPPPPGPGELQVRIQARGVQYVDVLMLAGKYQFRPEPPFIPGSEGAGEVVAVGPGVTGFKPGDRVMSRHRLGAFAHIGNSPAENLNPVPAGMSLDPAPLFGGA